MNRGIQIVIGTLVVVATAAAAVVGPSGAVGGRAAAATTVTTSSTLTLTAEFVLENAVLVLTNTKRLLVGCPPLRMTTELRRAARSHSVRMARAGVMTHQVYGEPVLGRRVTLAGYLGWTRVAENIAAGYTSATLVLRAWWNSATHRRNITDCSLRDIGVGVVWTGRTMYWTQDFGRR